MDFGDNFFYVETSPPSPDEFTSQSTYGSYSEETGNSISEQQKSGMILFFAVTILSVLFVSICSAREWFKDCTVSACYKKICCRESQDIQNSDQYYEDRALAENLQRRLNEEERQRERLSKRKDRRMWYEYYMKPWTTVVKKSDLFYANSSREEEEGAIMVQTETKTGEVDSDIEEVSEDVDRSECRVCDEDDENAVLSLKLPGSGRCVDGTCALCIDEYEVGDMVVWSGLECPHVFHKECLMQWLSKGKKRCPICRHWFVPGSKIDDQKVSHGESWQRALSEMEQTEREEKEKQKTREKKEIESENDLEQGSPSSESISTITTSESLHINPGHDSECSISWNDSRDSEHLRLSEVNGDVSSIEVVTPEK